MSTENPASTKVCGINDTLTKCQEEHESSFSTSDKTEEEISEKPVAQKCNEETVSVSSSETKDVETTDFTDAKYSWTNLPKNLIDQIKGVIYGNCVGDAIGLLTEFMSKKQANKVYHPKGIFKFMKSVVLEYDKKSEDAHRFRWKQGDWTDDSDQMILILLTLVENNGQFVEKVFASKLSYWVKHGYPELGDHGGMGLGMTTGRVLRHPSYMENPHEAAHDVWVKSGYRFAPNGGVMRTSVLGTFEYYDLEKVIANTKSACKVTHADPRCVASCIAVTIAIALMLQGKYVNKNGDYNVNEITQSAHEHAEKVLEDQGHKEELKQYMFEENLEKLKLDEKSSIGYTFKCLGAGFWAFRQSDFRDAITKVTMEAGDADTNCAVAGALLGCKIGFSKLPDSWVTGLCHREWLDGHITRYLNLVAEKYPK